MLMKFQNVVSNSCRDAQNNIKLLLINKKTGCVVMIRGSNVNITDYYEIFELWSKWLDNHSAIKRYLDPDCMLIFYFIVYFIF